MRGGDLSVMRAVSLERCAAFDIRQARGGAILVSTPETDERIHGRN
jgi:hypothetical protein